jgi:type II secretory pathway pseudopilin PulG
MANKEGFTLVEVLMIVAMISVLAVASFSVLTSNVDQDRYDSTLKRMLQIRTAILGDENGGPSGNRFGYLGDIGGYPDIDAGISAILSPPGTLIPWTINTHAKFGSGWNGPYLPDLELFSGSYLKDGWGNDFIYSADTDPITLTSFGADAAPGGSELNSDITLLFPIAMSKTKVHGVIQKSGTPWNGKGVIEINYPDGATGKIIQQTFTIAPGTSGEFRFENIPPGERSVTLYLPDQIAPVAVLGPYLVKINRPQNLIVLGSASNPIDLSASP